MALAAVIICVLAMGITSIGGPERVVRMVRQVVGDRDVEKTSASKKVKTIECEDEEKAYQKIKDTFNTEVVKITWKPKEMHFGRLEIDEDNQIGEFYYNYKKNKIAYIVNCSYKNNAWGIDTDDGVEKKYTKKINDCTIYVKKYKSQEKYSANFRYHNVEYFLIGIMDDKEFEKIINNLIFPE